MAEFDDFTIDDRIAGLKDELIKVDKERAEQMMLRQRFDNINTNDEFFNLQREFAFPSPRSLIKIEQKNEPIWSPDVNEKKKKALETLEKLSNELENEFKEDDKLKVSESKKRERKKRTQKVENENEEKKESNTDVRALVFVLTIIFGVYVTIGLGKAYLKNL
jgi:hypothetical protein